MDITTSWGLVPKSWEGTDVVIQVVHSCEDLGGGGEGGDTGATTGPSGAADGETLYQTSQMVSNV
jgi:hypothetical protein